MQADEFAQKREQLRQLVQKAVAKERERLSCEHDFLDSVLTGSLGSAVQPFKSAELDQALQDLDRYKV